MPDDYVTSLVPHLQAMPPGLAAKLVKVHAAIFAVPALGYNTDQNYQYRRASDVSLAVREALSQNGILLLWQPDVQAIGWREWKTSTEKLMREATVWFNATFFDSETGESYTIRWPGVAADTQDKVLAKCATAAQKTFLIAQFQIPDDGADETSERAERARPQKTETLSSPEKVTGTITAFERSGAGAHVTVKDRRFWVGPILVRKFSPEPVGKGCALMFVKRSNAKGEYLEITAVLSVADKTTSAAELPPAKPKQQTLPGAKQ